MAEVIFTGDFNLDQALAKFNTFANSIETRMKTLSKSFATGGAGGATPQGTAAMDKETRRQQKITDDHLKYNIKAAQDETKARQKEQEKQLRDQQAYENKLNTMRNAEGRRRRKELADAEKEALQTQDKIGNGFLQLAIRSYAFHQIGALLNQAVTQPLKNLATQIIDTTLRFDTLEQLLTTRGGRSMEQVGNAIDSVGKIAKLRNLDLEMSVSLYSKLFEATRGALDDKLFEKIGAGLSNVLTSIEAGEKRAFFGQIQDVLGGGNVANLDRTLSLAPALKSVFDEIKRTKEAVSDQEALIEAFDRLGKLPALNDLATRMKNLNVEIELLQHRLGEIYKDDLTKIFAFIEEKIFPIVNALVTRFEALPPVIQNIAAVLTGLIALLAPVISTFGTLILLFPHLLEEGAFLTRITAALPRILALLNPISAIIAAIVAGIGLLVSYNIAGSGTAFDALIRTLRDSLLTVLADIYNIASDLYGIVEGFITILGKFPIIQTIISGLGGMVTILLNLTNAIVAVNQPLHALATTLDFLNDVIHGDFELGFNKLALAQKKLTKQVYDSMPILYKFTDWVVGTFVTGSSSKDTLNKEIIQLEGNIKELSNTIDQEALASFEAYINKVNGLVGAYQRAAASATNLTTKIREQNDAFAKQSLQGTISRSTQYQEASSRLADFQRQQQEARISGLDYTTASGREAARAGQANVDSQAESAAQQAQRARISAALAEKLMADRERYLAEVNKETKKNEEKLDKDIAQIYVDYANRIATIIAGGGTITKEKVEQEVFEPTRKQIATTPNYENVRSLTTRIEQDRASLNLLSKTEADNNKELQDYYLDRAKELEKKIREGEEAERIVALDIKFKEEADKLDKQTAQIELLIKEAIENAREIGDATKAFQEIEKARIQLQEVENQRLALELTHVTDVYGKGTQAELDSKKAAVQSDHRKRSEEIAASSSAAVLQIRKRFIKSEEENLKTLKELQGLVVKNADTRIDTLVQLLALTGDEAKYGAELEKVTKERNRTLAESAIQPLAPLGNKLFESLQKTVSNVGGTGDVESTRVALAQYKNLVKIMTDTLTVNTTSEDVQAMIDNSKGIAEALRVILLSAGAAPEDKLQIQATLDAYENFIKGLVTARKLLDEQVPAVVKINEAKIQGLEMQERINDLTRTELELTQEILQNRLKNFAPDVTGLKSFGGAIINILTGNQKAQYELQKAMLELQKRGAQIELDLAILRLQAELEIYILKRKQEGATEAEIKKIRDSYTAQIELLKEQGELRQTLIDQQIAQLSEFTSGLGGLISGIFGKVLGKFLGKDKPRVTVLDDNGNEQEIDEGEDEDDPAKLDDGIITDASVDKTEKNAKTSMDWLEKLTGSMKTTKDIIFSLGDAIEQLSDKSIKNILRTIKAELKALGAKFAVKALEFAALALAAAVFGDYGTAAKAAGTAAAYGIAAAAAYGAAGLIGTIDGTGASTTQSSAARAAGTNNATDASRDKQILKQQANQVFIQLDIRTDDGIIIKKNIKALNQNTELTNLTMNTQEGWAFAPTP